MNNELSNQSTAHDELDALLLKTAPRRSYSGFVLGLVCASITTFGGYIYASVEHMRNQRPLIHKVDHRTLDSLLARIDSLERRTYTSPISRLEYDSLANVVRTLQTPPDSVPR